MKLFWKQIGFAALLCLVSTKSFAQTVQGSTQPMTDVDTTAAYVQYPQRLYIGYFQSLQRYVVHIAPDIGKTNFEHLYSSGTRNVSGLTVGYDKLFLSFNFRSVKSNVVRRGDNKTFNTEFALGSNKLMFEGLYQRHRGMYDANSPDYNPVYAKPNPYYRKPGFTVNTLKFKTMYYTHHRNLAMKAHQGNNFRQLRSAVSPVFTIGFFRTRIKSSDGLTNDETRPYFGSEATLNSLRTAGVTFGAGIAGTLVFYKRFYAGGVGLIYLEPQWRRYRYFEKTDVNTFKTPLSGEIRLTTGYNAEKFYSGFWVQTAFDNLNGNHLNMATNLSSAGFSIAFRLKINHEPGLVGKLKSNKYYKML